MAGNVARRPVSVVRPHTKPNRLTRLDRRSTEWHRIEQVRAGLLDHLGGRVSAVQAALVDRCATLTVMVEVIERKAFRENGGMLSERDVRVHLSYSNALARCLKTLGIKAAPAPVRSLVEAFADEAAD